MHKCFHTCNKCKKELKLEYLKNELNSIRANLTLNLSRDDRNRFKRAEIQKINMINHLKWELENE